MKRERKEMQSYFVKKTIRVALRVMCVLPIQNNKIIFRSHVGAQCSCNPKYIAEYLKANYKNRFKIVWILNDPSIGCDEDINVKKISLRCFYHYITSKVIIDNVSMPMYIPKRRSQYVINTWHGGGAYKGNAPEKLGLPKYQVKSMRVSANATDLATSSCKKFSEIIPEIIYKYAGEIMPCGMPRNDILINGDKDKIRKIVCDSLNINEDSLIVLYAPTYRGTIITSLSGGFAPNSLDMDIDFEKLRSVFEKKTEKKPVILCKMHYRDNKSKVSSYVINVVDYPDMQELLCAADILISDYSSTIWDFSLTKKPCFLYCPDLDDYIDDRGIYTPIETWPGILCRTNEELEQAILNFNEDEYIKKVEKHHTDLGSYETGTACEQVCRRIAQVCGIEE